jgi:hypothetical protein
MGHFVRNAHLKNTIPEQQPRGIQNFTFGVPLIAGNDAMKAPK